MIIGSTAQWIAHKIDVAMPTPSQFIFIFIGEQKYAFCNNVASFIRIIGT